MYIPDCEEMTAAETAYRNNVFNIVNSTDCQHWEIRDSHQQLINYRQTDIQRANRRDSLTEVITTRRVQRVLSETAAAAAAALLMRVMVMTTLYTWLHHRVSCSEMQSTNRLQFRDLHTDKTTHAHQLRQKFLRIPHSIPVCQWLRSAVTKIIYKINLVANCFNW